MDITNRTTDSIERELEVAKKLAGPATITQYGYEKIQREIRDLQAVLEVYHEDYQDGTFGMKRVRSQVLEKLSATPTSPEVLSAPASEDSEKRIAGLEADLKERKRVYDRTLELWKADKRLMEDALAKIETTFQSGANVHAQLMEEQSKKISQNLQSTITELRDENKALTEIEYSLHHDIEMLNEKIAADRYHHEAVVESLREDIASRDEAYEKLRAEFEDRADYVDHDGLSMTDEQPSRLCSDNGFSSRIANHQSRRP